MARPIPNPISGKPLIIEARINEYMARGPNPHVPYTPEEIAESATRAREAGASIVHFHARGSDGTPLHNAGVYAEAIRLIRAQSDILVHPTLGQVNVDGGVDARTAHIRALCDQGLAPDFVPVDTGSTNIDRFVSPTVGFETGNRVYANSVETLLGFTRVFREMGVRPQFLSWTVAFTRMFEALRAMGEVEDVPFVLFELTDHGILGGHPGTVRGLLAHLDFLPEAPLEWTVCNKVGNLTAPGATAIEMGGHVSVGLGDYLWPELGTPTNAEVIAKFTQLAQTMGRPIASPAQTREMLRLPAVAKQTETSANRLAV
ncbi:MAG: 3-keto-5-aminohexanoate cleavage protein [Pseudomonadota bacterium]